jgi:hypothetical protein
MGGGFLPYTSPSNPRLIPRIPRPGSPVLPHLQKGRWRYIYKYYSAWKISIPCL